MSVSIEKTGKTIHDAIQAALAELNVSEENAVIEVLDEGDSGGILGIGKKNARVRVSIDEDVPEAEDSVYYGDD
jgi:spoIIIJ-associated protein